MYFFFFSDSRKMNDNELIRDAFEEVFFRKLRMEGYCDLNPILGNPKIEHQKVVMEKAKLKYEAEKEALAELIKLRNELRKDELMAAVIKSEHSYEEIMAFIKGSTESEDE
ncbi:hypothetical protein [Butyrivibrio sp. AE3006]|uniref:hypothetical protein n=1 Tax=Butyrivibrio sp. AE3006 TaxID=1280673 RepID=UPI00042019B9|nr:hypothetical protein [Butyrivibrio sp. AE3006]